MDIVPVYVGLDYHEETIQVCVRAEDGKVLFNRDVSRVVDRPARVEQQLERSRIVATDEHGRRAGESLGVALCEM